MRHFFFFDPYLSLFSHHKPELRDDKGKVITRLGQGHKSILALAEVVPQLLVVPTKADITRETWKRAQDKYEHLIGIFREMLSDGKTVRFVRLLDHDGTVLAPEKWNDMPEHQVLIAMYQVFNRVGDTPTESDLPDVRGDLIHCFCISCLKAIDDAILASLDGESIGLAIRASVECAQALEHAKLLAVEGAVGHGPVDADAASKILVVIREGSRRGVQKSVEIRQAEAAVKYSEVITAAKKLGWPTVTRGINKPLSIEFECTAENIRQILAAHFPTEGGSLGK
jgi:hypothetical protein